MVESIPTPKPATILPTIIMAIDVANVCKAPPTKKIHDPYRIVFRRPMISPTRPTIKEEMKAPISRMATMVPTSALLGSLKYLMKSGPLP
jgi:hypothetical protein